MPPNLTRKEMSFTSLILIRTIRKTKGPLPRMGHVQTRSSELRHTKKQLAHKAKYSTRSEMSVREQRTRLQELKAEFLTHPKLDSYVAKLFDIALDDDHNNQAMALKLIADRVLPNNAFAHTAKGSNAVQINISGLTVDVQEKEIENSDMSSDCSDIEGEVIDG